MARTGKPIGRPRKKPEEKFVRKTITLPREVSDDLDRDIPARERSAFIAWAIGRRLALKKMGYEDP